MFARWFFPVLLLLGAVTAGSLAAAVVTGSVALPWAVLWGEGDPVSRQIFWELRLPRALLAALVGATLALTGLVMQALVRNPLADPYVLGASSGASSGAVAALALGYASLVGPAAFLGSLIALVLVVSLARSGSTLSSNRLILAGVAISYGFSSVTSFLTIVVDPARTKGIVFWLLGGFSGARWTDVQGPGALLLLGCLLLAPLCRTLNLLAAGEETAWTLGIDGDRWRAMLLGLCAALTGGCVAVAGPIGFVGILVPHASRMLVGADHRRVMPITLLLGAQLLIWADLAGRTLLSPEEIPVGILTALAGVPFFLWLLAREARR